MKENFAQDIIEDLSDGRSMMSREAVAEAITSVNGETTTSVYETDQETYTVEMSTWDDNGDSHKVTAIRENGNEVYVLRETNGADGYNSELAVDSEGIYAESIDSKEDFGNLLSSLEEREEIGFETKLEDEYAVRGGVGRKAQD